MEKRFGPFNSFREMLVALLCVELLMMMGFSAISRINGYEVCRAAANETYPHMLVYFGETEDRCTFYHPLFGKAEEMINPIN